MKKLLRCILWCMLLCATPAWAQRHTTHADDIIVGGSPEIGYARGISVNPETVTTDEDIHVTPQTGTFFAEFLTLFGPQNLGIGLQAAVVPHQWGCYGSYHADWGNSGFTFGAVLRAKANPSLVDCQFYGGISFGQVSPGIELGVRFASVYNYFPFMGSSFSFAFRQYNYGPAFAIGLTIDLSTSLWGLYW